MTQHRISRIVALTFFSFVLVMSLWNISCSPAEQAEATSKQELSDIEQVVATQQIYNVVMRYIRGHDRADRELVRSVYWEDGYDDHGIMWQGNAWEFSKFFTRTSMSNLGLGSQEEPSSGSLTFLANHTVEFDGRDVAYSESYFTTSGVKIIDEETASQGWFAGRYIDRFERRDGEWKIFHRICVQDWGRTQTFPRSELAERNVFAGTFPTGNFYPEDIVYQRSWLDNPGSRPDAKPNDPPTAPEMFQERMPYDNPRYDIVSR